jgi:fatty acid desaturase
MAAGRQAVIPTVFRVVRSDAYGWRSTARILGVLTVLIVAVPLTVSYVSPWGLLMVGPLLGARIYKVTILLHDCVHGTLFAQRRWNRLVGRLAAASTGVEFKAFARLHAKHHRRYGQADDPQGEDYLRLSNAGPSRLLWHLLNPLVGFGLGKLDTLKAAVGSGARRDLTSHLLWTGSVQGVIALVVTAGGRLWWLIPFYPGCAATFGLFCSRVRGFCEHVAPPGEESAGFVRSHSPNLIEGLFFYDLGFNYHVEHHLYPTAPSYQLQALHAHLGPPRDPRFPVSPSLSHTIKERFLAAYRRRVMDS